MFSQYPPPEARLHAPRGKHLLKVVASVLMTLAVVSCFSQPNQKGRFDFLLWLYNNSVYQNRYPSVYTPPWFFDAQGQEDASLRPTVSVATTPTGYGVGWEFPVTYTLPANRTIHSVVIMRPGSVTHSLDMEQRLIRLYYDIQSPGSAIAYGPYDANIAPPGWYMVFVVDSADSYSQADWIQVLPDSLLMRPGG